MKKARNQKKRVVLFSATLLIGCVLVAVCSYSFSFGSLIPSGKTSTSVQAIETELSASISADKSAGPAQLPASDDTKPAASMASVQSVAAPSPTPLEEPTVKPTPAPKSEPTAEAQKKTAAGNSRLVMLDPGHQRKGNHTPEQVGPDVKETKPAVSSGTVGVSTKKPEYVLNLEVSLLIKAELSSRGIEVAMTRETHDVDISNKQRAEMANEAGAALAVRIHADGDSSPKTKGFSVLYPSASTAAVKPIAADSREAAGYLLERLKAATDTSGRGLSARSDLSGFNWSKVPVVLVELGFMTNPEEDELMSEEGYQKKLAKGIADGIEQFLQSR
ncbi:N-acetylmuramoyl-L-alanine amidase family protein [Paenibacillus alba]|uniref:N-acetylmuramoyl-L-alanine amidase n=1 Tax=Paenibacillus alba TaxID=1197127 RepID=A0ABU6FZJ7_9BACL|nr:N-acetylmuramoyl-L-alanine amidase [Paenibacillus alba]MEC0227328.1 N-acetylmuramoyl-L-alanine amidase [Paenibacillus alba]